MLRMLRRHLRQIRYYSATPVRTRWTMAMDIALFASLALAIPGALLSDLIVIRTSLHWEQHGRLARGEGGTLYAELIEESQVNEAWRQLRPHGTFVLYVPQHDGGLPLVSSRRPLPIQVDLEIFAVAEPDVQAALQPGAPVREAIDFAVQAGPREVQAAWAGRSGPTTRYWGSLAMNIVFWWIGLYVALTMLVLLMRGGHALFEQQRRVRRRRMSELGRCAACGYDLRGLEFAERCPECGELA